jgi:hypothetical protein
MVDNFKKYIEECDAYDRQCIAWIKISSIAAIAVVIIIFEWIHIANTNLTPIFVSIGLAITVVWWYWTTSIVRKLLRQRKTMAQMLINMSLDINYLKENLVKKD